MSESGAPISGRVIGTIAAEDVANGGNIVRTGGTTFTVGSEVDVYLGHEERLTREEWAGEFAAAIKAAAEAVGGECVAVMSKDDGRFVASICGFGEDFYGPDPITALEALAAAAKPALPDPEDMSAEECEAELDAAEAVWICFRNYNMWQCHVVVGNERLEQTVHVDWRTKERALRAAVRALREHQASQSRT